MTGIIICAGVFISGIALSFIFGAAAAVAARAFDITGRQVARGIRIIRAEFAAFFIQAVACFTLALLVVSGTSFVIFRGAGVFAIFMAGAVIGTASDGFGAARAGCAAVALLFTTVFIVQAPIIPAAGRRSTGAFRSRTAVDVSRTFSRIRNKAHARKLAQLDPIGSLLKNRSK